MGALFDRLCTIKGDFEVPMSPYDVLCLLYVSVAYCVSVETAG